MTDEAESIGAMAQRLNIQPILSSHEIESLVSKNGAIAALVTRQDGAVCLLEDGSVLTADIDSAATHSLCQLAKIEGYAPTIRPTLKRIIRAKLTDQGVANAGDSRNDRSATVIEDIKNDLLSVAMAKGATDIHIEIREEKMALIRLRINGELQNYDELSYDDACALGNLLFITLSAKGVGFSVNSNLEGNIVETVRDKRIPIRLASGSDARGADIFLRLDIVGDNSLTLDDLGVSKEAAAMLKQAINSPHGMIIFSGPVGTGKSTLMRALIRKLPQTLKITFLEDPVENTLSNATHVQIDEKVDGHTMADMQKAVTRWDGDVNILGEIRDDQSVSTACTLVQIGRRVLTTLHATGVQAIPRRLISLGLSREMLAEPDFLRALVNQRLLPILCAHCALSVKTAPKEDVARWKTTLGAKLTKVRVRSEEGCKKCGHTGTVGRALIIEQLLLTAEDRRYIASGDAPGWEASLTRRGWESIEVPTRRLVLEGKVCPFTAEQLVSFKIPEMKNDH